MATNDVAVMTRPTQLLSAPPPRTQSGGAGQRGTWGISVRSSAPPGRQGAIREELPLRPLSDPVGTGGVAEMFPPGQRGAQQTQGLPRARGALQDSVHFLRGEESWGSGVRCGGPPSPPETSPAGGQSPERRGALHGTSPALQPKAVANAALFSDQFAECSAA